MDEILWTEAFGDGNSWFNNQVVYNGRDLSKEAARLLAVERQTFLQSIRNEITECMAGRKSMYVKLTAGRMAGSIARVMKIPKFHLGVASTRYSREDDPGKVEIVHESEFGRDRWRLRGYFYQANNHYQPKISDFEMIECEIDGKKILEFNCRTPNMKSARPVLMLGYQGPTVLVKGASAAKPEMTIKDRYNRVVKSGDLAIVARGSGMLLVGKIVGISDKRTVRIRHIGSTEDSSITNVRDDQVLLLSDDLKGVLMMEKLKAL